MEENEGLGDEGTTRKSKTARPGVAKKGGITAAAKRKFAAKNKDVEVTIKVKDEDGKIVDFPSEEVPSLAACAPKKKKKTATSKTVRADMTPLATVDAEDTLAMIKQALKTGAGKLTDELSSIDKPKKAKKTTLGTKKKEKLPKLEANEDEEVKETTVNADEDFQLAGDLESAEAANKKAGGKKPKKAKKVAKKKTQLDGIARFFNDYGESPHLQAIELSYLKYLEAQHAKESHLKAVKKLQILHALKTIQRFWKVKY